MMTTRRILSWALGVAVTVLAGCNSDPTLVSVGSEKQANEILVALHRAAGIGSARVEPRDDKRKPAYDIKIAANDLHVGREALYRLNLPREQPPGWNVMVEKTGIVSTRADERARLMQATTGELVRTFETIDRVVEARVHVVLPESDRWTGDAKGRSTAAVLIKYLPVETAEDQAGTAEVLPIDAESVRGIVAHSIQGLTSDDVTVTFARAHDWPALAGLSPRPAAAGLSFYRDRPLMILLVSTIVLAGLVAGLCWALYRQTHRGATPVAAPA